MRADTELDSNDVDYHDLLTRILVDIEPEIGRGQVATHIPALGTVDPNQFGMAVADLDGNVTGVGAFDVPFSLQSVTKAFALALVIASDGGNLWSRVGREPSGSAYNSLVQLEHENGIPRNPFINAGALVTTDRLLSLTGDARGAVLEFLQKESGNPLVDFDLGVAGSELDHGARNAALGYFMASHGNMENPVPDVLEHYFWQCSIRASCQDLALAGGFLARRGVRADGSRLITGNDAKRINAIMLTCGTYDAAGDFAYRVGLPGKSGVGGGILAIVPGRCAVCVWSPGRDARGNSVAGVAALDRFTTLTGLSVF